MSSYHSPQRWARFASRYWRRARKLAWWTVTGQLPRQLRDRHGLIRARWNYVTEAFLLRVGLRRRLREQLGLPPEMVTPKATALSMDSSAEPLLSILIPTFGQVDYTLRCLASIAANPPRVSFEVLVVDDASGDQRVAELREVSGIRLIERAQNLGFLLSCNDAAKQARGNFLLLLNNDTEIMPGALDALIETFEAYPEAGIVGARLLYPDGWQQEAGGIIWRDGSGWNYGNRDDPRRPEYSYVRDVDYVSGAAIMLNVAFWQELGGFDEHYVPAYCEDSDLCFRVRAAGRRVLYQPAAIVIHHEGVSHGTDTNKGLKAYQIANSLKLRDRWMATLTKNHVENGTRVMRARDRAFHRRVTLVLDNNVPQPDRDAGSRTIVAFLEALLAAGRQVKFWPLNSLAIPGYTEALQQRGIEVLYGPWCGDLPSWIAENGAEIDEVLISRPHVADETLADIRAHTQAPIVFYGHDLHYARTLREAESRGSSELRAESEQLLAQERRVWRAVDLSLYPSEEEAAAVRALEPDVLVRAITPYALAAHTMPPPLPAGRVGLLFVAGFGHPPNEDAACWFVGEILPLIRAAWPQINVTLAGSNPTERVRALAGPGIQVTGFISDKELGRCYDRARVVICPLRYGAGIKLKVVEALHQGIPLVTTTTGVQGLPGANEICGVADEPAPFAKAVLQLLDDDAAWIAQASAQRDFVGERFSAEVIRRELEACFADAGATVVAASA